MPKTVNVKEKIAISHLRLWTKAVIEFRPKFPRLAEKFNYWINSADDESWMVGGLCVRTPIRFWNLKPIFANHIVVVRTQTRKLFLVPVNTLFLTVPEILTCCRPFFIAKYVRDFIQWSNYSIYSYLERNMQAQIMGQCASKTHLSRKAKIIILLSSS